MSSEGGLLACEGPRGRVGLRDPLLPQGGTNQVQNQNLPWGDGEDQEEEDVGAEAGCEGDMEAEGEEGTVESNGGRRRDRGGGDSEAGEAGEAGEADEAGEAGEAGSGAAYSGAGSGAGSGEGPHRGRSDSDVQEGCW